MEEQTGQMQPVLELPEVFLISMQWMVILHFVTTSPGHYIYL